MDKPQLPYADVIRVIDRLCPKWRLEPAVVLAVRGYFLDSMGKPGANDRGIYDDAAFIVVPPEQNSLTRWNFNTDPSAYRYGIATLTKGVWRFVPKIHKTYPAFGQAEPVTVTRDGQGKDTGWFGINLHHGGLAGGTSSLGCQTVPVNQWTVPDPGRGFRKTLYDALDVTLAQVEEHGKTGVPGKDFAYVLTDHQDVEAIIGRAF